MDESGPVDPYRPVSKSAPAPAPDPASAGGPAGIPIGDVSRELGVPMPTLRSWERRYAMPPTVRLNGKHRRYTPAELHSLRLMRDETARGMSASAAAESVRVLLAAEGAAAEFVAEFLAAADRLDSAGVRNQLSLAHTQLGLATTLDDVLLPAMRQVGLWWQTGRCDVDEEHLATESTLAWLTSLTTHAPEPGPGPPIILTCGPTDLHTIGLESLAVLLRYRKQTCRQLGVRTPVATLEKAILSSGAHTVVVVSHLSTGRQRAIESLRAARSLGTAVFYSGNAFSSPRSRRNVPGTYLGTRLGVACETIATSIAPTQTPTQAPTQAA